MNQNDDRESPEPKFNFDTFHTFDQLIRDYEELDQEFNMHIETFTASLQQESDQTIQMDEYIINNLKNLIFQQSQKAGISYSYSSINHKDMSKFNLDYNIDLPANQNGWFYQSDDQQNQFIIFYYDKPVQINYYFLMTYPLPQGHSHLRHWRVVTINNVDHALFDKDHIEVDNLSIEILDERNTEELNEPNKVCGFPISKNPIVNNVVFQMIDKNCAGNYRLTLQNLFFSCKSII